ncbi:MAG TPA: hypothetical protein VFT74_13345, partial [Isosphaeraceae bacterium]|nr:hypothetical protein [Isosphaeraceae bacterium]
MRRYSTSVLGLIAFLGIGAVGLRTAHADLLDPNAFASLGTFDPTLAGQYLVKQINGTPTIVDPNGQTLFSGVESNGVAVFDFNSITVTSTNSAPITIFGQAGPTAFLSRGDISVTNNNSSMPHIGPYVFNFNGLFPNGPGAGGNGN